MCVSSKILMDGVFDKTTLFADKMVFPQGVCWHDGSVYVSSPPKFWRLQDKMAVASPTNGRFLPAGSR